MKKQIICTNCVEKHPKLFNIGNPYPGEYIKNIEGEALNDYLCDYCNAEIPVNKKCHAVSFGLTRIKHVEWEKLFIKEKI